MSDHKNRSLVAAILEAPTTARATVRGAWREAFMSALGGLSVNGGSQAAHDAVMIADESVLKMIECGMLHGVKLP